MRRLRIPHRPRHAEPSLLSPPRWVLAASVAIVTVVVAGVAWGAAGAGSVLPTQRPAAGVLGQAPAGTGSSSAATLQGSARDLAVAGPGSLSASAPATVATLQAAAFALRDSTLASQLAASGIPVTALRAYRRAAAREHRLDPSCHLVWPLLAGIGRVESDHGRFAGAVLHADGFSTPPIIGIPLNGHGTALIRDTDHGRLDGDPVYDHAVGPMQFIPSTWASWGVDADADGVANPFDINDAAAAAADYLCAAGVDLATAAGQVRAIRSYNDSDAYITLVMAVERVYAAGAGIVVPVAPGPGATGPGPTLPPVDPGPPPVVHRRHHHRERSSSTPPRSPSETPSSSRSSSSAPPSSSSSTPSSPAGSSSSTPGCPTPSSSDGSSTASSSGAPSGASSGASSAASSAAAASQASSGASSDSRSGAPSSASSSGSPSTSGSSSPPGC